MSIGDLPPGMPRRPETWVLLCNLMLKLGSNSAQSKKKNPRERPNVTKHAIGGYLRQQRPTPAPALMRVLHSLRC